MGKFPILWQNSRRPEGVPRFVPWSFVAPHEAQAQRNHDQTLKRLAERGGLCPEELWAVVHGKSCFTTEIDEPRAIAWLRDEVPHAE